MTIYTEEALFQGLHFLKNILVMPAVGTEQTSKFPQLYHSNWFGHYCLNHAYEVTWFFCVYVSHLVNIKTLMIATFIIKSRSESQQAVAKRKKNLTCQLFINKILLENALLVTCSLWMLPHMNEKLRNHKANQGPQGLGCLLPRPLPEMLLTSGLDLSLFFRKVLNRIQES